MQPCVNCGRDLPEGAILCPYDGTPIRATMQLAPNQKVGEYILQEKIGEGAMGEVWRGVHPQIAKKVAIKALHTGTLVNQESLARFIQEAKIVNEIQHRNLVDIFSFGEIDGSRPYFIMEYLDGKPLSDYLAEKGPLPFSEIVEIFEQVCAALEAAHHKGVLHRDIKPSNIFLLFQRGKPPFVKLIDFGIAKLPKGDTATLTQTNAIFGTPAYMSPEHCDGVRFLDHRADLYSLGIVLYECITGQNPFATEPGAPMGEILLRHLSLEPPPLSQAVTGRTIPAALDRFMKRALAKNKDERPGSAAEFFQELRESLGKLAQEKQLTSARPKKAEFISPNAPRRIGWLAFPLAAALGLSAFLYSQIRPPAVIIPEVQRPAEVSLQISSSPPGANVTLAGELLGVTPLATSLPFDDLPRPLVIEREGYETQTTTISLRADVQKSFALTPVKQEVIIAPPTSLPTHTSKPAVEPPKSAPIAPKIEPPKSAPSKPKPKTNDDPDATFDPFKPKKPTK